MRPLAAVIAALLCAVLAVPSAVAAGAGAGWREWDDGLREARVSGKPVLVDVYTDWCGWCKRMDRDVYARADVRDYLQRRFVAIKLDAEGGDAEQWKGASYTSRSLAAQFRVTGYPTTIFLDASGEHLVNVPGYVPADRFLLLLRYVGERHIDRISFDEFVKRAGKSAR
jgi:thioredoxin-related protein